jgi:zinc-ribbon domain
MNCPKCGLQTLPEQKFCRSCGARLQLDTQRLAESTKASVPEVKSAIVKPEEHPPSSWMLWGFIMMFIGVAIGVTGKKLLHEDIVTVVGVLISLVGIFLTCYPYLSPSRRPRPEPDSSSEPDSLTQSQSPKHLPQGSKIDYVPSITERTTDLLKASATKRKPKEDGESQA